MHPILFSMNENTLPDEPLLFYPYSERGGQLAMDEEESYAGEGTIASTRTYEWNHSVAELLQGLINAGLVITEVADDDTMEWEFWKGQPEVSPGRWGVPPELATRLPLMYRVQAKKPA